MGEKSTDGGRFHMFDGGTEKIAFYTDGTANHISAGNLGIGKTPSTYRLEVESADESVALFEGSRDLGLLLVNTSADSLVNQMQLVGRNAANSYNALHLRLSLIHI